MTRIYRALPALLLSLAGACSEAPSEPVSPATPVLRPGEVFSGTGDRVNTIVLAGGETGAEYAYVAYNGSETPGAQMMLAVGEGEVTGPGGLTPRRTPSSGEWNFHDRLRMMEQVELTPKIDALHASAPTERQALPAWRLGERVRLNARPSCDPAAASIRSGRVVAITTRTIIVADEANPAGGFTVEEYAGIAEQFDRWIYPLYVQNFGTPTDIDQNERIVIFFTSAVNELTAPNSGSYVGGFFWAGDLFPRQPTPRAEPCANSNYGELFYMLVPDPQGEVRGNRFSKAFVQKVTPAVLAHELQHLINASRRLYLNSAPRFEEVWLNEGLSHIAEELLFFQESGLAPGNNLSLPELSATEASWTAFQTYQLQNMERLSSFLWSPDYYSLYGSDDLPTRGAAWQFLRYIADRRGGLQTRLWFDLANSTESGLKNLEGVLGVSPHSWIRDWGISVLADDAVTTDDRYRQPSWNFRSVMPAIRNSGETFPLHPLPLSREGQLFQLPAGGLAYLSVSIPPGGEARVQTRVGGAAPPAHLTVSIVRIR